MCGWVKVTVGESGFWNPFILKTSPSKLHFKALSDDSAESGKCVLMNPTKAEYFKVAWLLFSGYIFKLD